VVNTSLLDKLRELTAFPVESNGVDPGRSSYERFAIPYSFKPRLSFAEAVVAAGGALLRIFLGSFLFAVWGTYSFLAWSTIRNFFLRGIVLVVLIVLFAVCMALLMLAISALVRMVWPHRREHPLKVSPRI
jgi:hypothetical protein